MIIFGINPVSEALRTEAGVTRLHIASGKERNPRVSSLTKLADKYGIPVTRNARVDKMSNGGVDQGVAAELPDLVKPLKDVSSLGDHLVMFDGIMDPHNFGAALRVCEVFGFSQVIYHDGNSSGLNPTAIKVSAGAAFHLEVYSSNLNRAILKLKDLGYTIMIMDSSGETSLYDCPLADKFCLVMGSEDRGVRHAIRRLADQVITIPMRGRLDSLNVSCALSCALSEMSRRLPWPVDKPDS